MFGCNQRPMMTPVHNHDNHSQSSVTLIWPHIWEHVLTTVIKVFCLFRWFKCHHNCKWTGARYKAECNTWLDPRWFRMTLGWLVRGDVLRLGICDLWVCDALYWQRGLPWSPILINEITMCTIFQEGDRGKQKVVKWESWLALGGFESKTLSAWPTASFLHRFIG